MIDAHLHLRDPRILPYHTRFVKEAFDVGVTACIDCAVNPEQWACEVACAFDVTTAFGLHPWYVTTALPDWLEILEATLVAHPNALVGEIGLDGIRKCADGGVAQRSACVAQLALAARLGRPVVCHGARMWTPLFCLLEEWIDRLPAVMLHGVSCSVEQLQHPLLKKRNLWFSVGGGVLASGAKTLPALVKALPLDRLLVETDAPDMFPVSGEPLVLGQYHALYNHPANLPTILRAVAVLRDLPYDEMIERTIANTNAFICAS